jgi:ankyrin repeat protein
MALEHNLPHTATLEDYNRQAEELFTALRAREDAALWKFKWIHPFYRGKPVGEVDPDALDLEDARLVVARDYSFHTWHDLEKFARDVQRDGPVRQFEIAVEAVVSGDIDKLKSMLREGPPLAQARSARSHRATLLHYIAANGVEDVRQKTPPNAVEVAKVLLEAGADPDAPAIMYDNLCTTMSMLVSSSPPAQAGLQADLAETLVDHGARHIGPGSEWKSNVMTALAFGFTTTAQRLVKRGAPVDDLPTAAGLGRIDDVKQLLATSDAKSRQVALALASQHGHDEVVRLLLDAGEDPNRYNPEGFHAHSTPLHQAIASDRAQVVQLLLDRGARMDIRDKVYQGNALDWALYCERPAIADQLRNRGATKS